MVTNRSASGVARAAARSTAARAGELAAAEHLASQGYGILARNLRLGRDEIDLLALSPDRRSLVVVEVKCRLRAGARPEERVDGRKRARLVRAAERLAAQSEFRGLSIRFDVIGICGGPGGAELVHWPAAFDAG